MAPLLVAIASVALGVFAFISSSPDNLSTTLSSLKEGQHTAVVYQPPTQEETPTESVGGEEEQYRVYLSYEYVLCVYPFV